MLSVLSMSLLGPDVAFTYEERFQLEDALYRHQMRMLAPEQRCGRLEGAIERKHNKQEQTNRRIEIEQERLFREKQAQRKLAEDQDRRLWKMSDREVSQHMYHQARDEKKAELRVRASKRKEERARKAAASKAIKALKEQILQETALEWEGLHDMSQKVCGSPQSSWVGGPGSSPLGTRNRSLENYEGFMID